MDINQYIRETAPDKIELGYLVEKVDYVNYPHDINPIYMMMDSYLYFDLDFFRKTFKEITSDTPLYKLVGLPISSKKTITGAIIRLRNDIIELPVAIVERLQKKYQSKNVFILRIASKNNQTYFYDGILNLTYKFHDNNINEYLQNTPANKVDLGRIIWSIYITLYLYHNPLHQRIRFVLVLDILINQDVEILPKPLIDRIIKLFNDIAQIYNTIPVLNIGNINNPGGFYYTSNYASSVSDIPDEEQNIIEIDAEEGIIYTMPDVLFSKEEFAYLEELYDPSIIISSHNFYQFTSSYLNENVSKMDVDLFIHKNLYSQENNQKGIIILIKSMEMVDKRPEEIIVDKIRKKYNPEVIIQFEGNIIFGKIDKNFYLINRYVDNTLYLNILDTYLDQSLTSKLLFLYPYAQTITNKQNEVVWRSQGGTITVLRNNILTSYLYPLINQNLWGVRCSIEFAGEKGYDAGGLTNETFNLISTELKNKFFICKESTSGGCYYMIPSNPEFCYKVLRYSPSYCYNYLGRLIAKTIKEGYIINITFSHVILALFLGKSLSSIYDVLEFIKLDDAIYANSLLNPSHKQYIIENAEDFITNKGLKPVEQNYDQFLEEKIEEYLGINLLNPPVYQSFVEGFHSIIPLNTFVPKFRRLFEDLSFLEINSLLVGKFSVDKWRQQTILEYQEERITDINNYPQIERIEEAIRVYRWFWELITEFEENTQRKILVFQSGLSYIIPEREYIISINTVSADFFPSAHTCSLQLVFSINYTREILREKLINAIDEGLSFEFAGGGSSFKYYHKYRKYKRKYLIEKIRLRPK